MPKIQIPKSRTQSIKGDACLTTLIDPFSFLEHLLNEDCLAEEQILKARDEEVPDKGRCQ